MKTKRLYVLSMLVCATQFGCPMMAPNDGSLGTGLMDTDDDGFGNLEVPEGVDDSRNIAIELINELTRAQLESLFAEVDLQGFEFALDAVAVDVTLDTTLTYENGAQITQQEVRELGPFEIRFEAACPETVEAVVSVDASFVVPFIGTRIPVFSEELPPFVLTQGVEGSMGFECDKLISLTSSFDERSGGPTAEITIEDF
jgi:hypothetical protein